MSMVINTNISSITAQRHLAQSRLEMEQAMERLSSGLRINSAMDDAAGLTIAHSLDSKITSLNQAVRNANDGVALIQLAEGALDEVSVMLTRMKELSTQAVNGTYSSADLTNLDKEFQQLGAEITRISKNTLFNGINVLDTTDTKSFQVGDTSTDVITTSFDRMGNDYLGSTAATASTAVNANTDTADLTSDFVDGSYIEITVGSNVYRQAFVDDLATSLGKVESLLEAKTGDTVTVTGGNVFKMTANGFSWKVYSGTLGGRNITTATNAGNALASVDNAIAKIDSFRAQLGANANRMEHAANNLMSRVEHQQSARSRIQDADYAVESANLAKAQVLQQAGTAMLAQANASSQNILSLLK